MKRSKRIFLRIFAVLAGLVVIYHIVWLINCLSYKKYVDRVGVDEFGNSSLIDEDGICYSAFYPNYLSLTGNLAICAVRPDDVKVGDQFVDMIIWPKPFSDSFKIGIMLETVTESNYNETTHESEVATDRACFLLDEDTHFIDEPNQYELEQWETAQDAVATYYEKANEVWGILGTVS